MLNTIGIIQADFMAALKEMLGILAAPEEVLNVGISNILNIMSEKRFNV